MLNLPLERAYRIDLGFSVRDRSNSTPRVVSKRRVQAKPVTDGKRNLLAALEDGLPLTARPYKAIGQLAGTSEEQVIARLSSLIDRRIISRFGLILRHRELGFTANAMAVWNIEDEDVDRVGARLAAEPFVTLCYRRPRRLPDWPYNLFCMIHGRRRRTVLDQIASLDKAAGIGDRPKAILFSRRRFKQRGAKLSAA